MQFFHMTQQRPKGKFSLVSAAILTIASMHFACSAIFVTTAPLFYCGYEISYAVYYGLIDKSNTRAKTVLLK